MPPRRMQSEAASEGEEEDDLQLEEGAHASSSQVRKAQNRIAQREFRLRKQQYVRDLEARVEVLSGDKDERRELMILLTKNLLKENKDLRNMLNTMAGFIGEGLGSCLPRLGINAEQLHAVLNRADTDTAHDAFLALKASKELEAANPGLPMGDVRRKPKETGKRKRNDSTVESESPASVSLRKDSHERSTRKTVQGSGASTPDHPSKSKDNSKADAPTTTATTTAAADKDPATEPNQLFGGYDYFFPDLEAFASSSSQQLPQGQGQFAPPAMPSMLTPGRQYPPLPQFQQSPAGMPQYGMGNGSVRSGMPWSPGVQQGPFAAYPYSGLQGYYGGPGTNTGFGLTVSPQQQQVISNLMGNPPGPSARPSNGANGPNSAQGQNGSSQGVQGISSYNSPQSQGQGQNAQNMSRSGTNGMNAPSDRFPKTFNALGPLPDPEAQAEVERQRNLRQAVANLTKASSALEGDELNPEKMAERTKTIDALQQELEAGDIFDRKTEALQLVTYHLNNFRMNHSYNLPPSLRPTKVQRTIPHEHVIDGMIFPSIRDRMILLRGQYDLVDCFHAMFGEWTIHGEDVLDHREWEISEKWLKQFHLIVDDEVYEITNKWRKSRGEPELIRRDPNEEA